MYVERHAASAFSFLQGASLPEAIVERAAALGYPAIALLDADGVYGAPRFHKAAAKAGPDLAMAIAALWGVHPLTTEVVDYLSQRTESMMAFFVLLTLYAAIRSADSRGGRWHALSIVA